MDESSQEPEVRSQNSDGSGQEATAQHPNTDELRAVVREVIGEFMEARNRTETLERRVNELVAEAEEARKSASVRAELQRLGVAKIDLAYKAVKDDVREIGDGNELREFLQTFVNENPELLPARLAGGSGASAVQKTDGHGPGRFITHPARVERGRDGSNQEGSSESGFADVEGLAVEQGQKKSGVRSHESDVGSPELSYRRKVRRWT